MNGVGPRLEDVRFARLFGADVFLIGGADLDGGMDVLQADEQDAHAELEFIRLGLDTAAQFLTGGEAGGGHDLVDIDADEETDHFAGGDLLQQLARIAVVVGPGLEVMDLILHWNTHREETDRGGFPARGGTGQDIGLFAAGHEQAEFVFIMGHRPENRSLLLVLCVVLEANVEALDFLGAEGVSFFQGPGELGVKARTQHFSSRGRVAESFEQRFFSGLDINQAGRAEENQEVEHPQPRGVLSKKLVEPGLGDFEPKLVVERMRYGGQDAFRTADDPDQSTVIEQLDDLALDPGPINLEQQRQQVFHCQQREQPAKGARQEEIEVREAGLRGAQCRHLQGQQIGSEEKPVGRGLQQSMLLQARQAGGESAEGKEHQREQAENGHRHQRLRQGWGPDPLAEPSPEPPGAAAFQQEQSHGETRHEEFLELFARPPRREGLGLLGVEERRTGRPAPGDFVKLELFQPFAALESHLEPTHQGHQRAQTQEGRGHLPAQGMGVTRHPKRGHAHNQQQQQIDQSIFLYVSLHDQVSSRSSNKQSAAANEAPT